MIFDQIRDSRMGFLIVSLLLSKSHKPLSKVGSTFFEHLFHISLFWAWSSVEFSSFLSYLLRQWLWASNQFNYRKTKTYLKAIPEGMVDVFGPINWCPNHSWLNHFLRWQLAAIGNDSELRIVRLILTSSLRRKFWFSRPKPRRLEDIVKNIDPTWEGKDKVKDEDHSHSIKCAKFRYTSRYKYIN